MSNIKKLLEKIERNPKNVKFHELSKVCDYYFGSSRQVGSHLVYKTPWRGDPRVNIQNKNGMAKPYQVRKVLEAIDKMEERDHGES
ncbi:UNVERIFIED_CONTAM: toxin HicA [Euhalothece sp. KZN 001]